MLSDFRKAKVLIFVILLLLLNGIYTTNGLKEKNLVHLIKNSAAGDEGLCIAFDEESYSAIEWSYPIPKDEYSLPKTESLFIPTRSSEYDCNFEEDQPCNSFWKLENYNISVNYLPISDARWEDFRVYFATNGTNIENRFEISKNATIGVSIRTGKSVDILLSEGYNPKTYPHYRITLGGDTGKKVFLTKYGEETKLSEYKSNLSITSADEWKHFKLFLSETGQIQIHDINKNILYLNATEAAISNTRYLFLNSSSPTLWKIHKNHFLYTNTSQAISFGPPINITSSNVCLSMYLRMCEVCSIYFYSIRGNKQEKLLEILPSKQEGVNNKWKHVKLIAGNITDDLLQIYINTNSNSTGRFWAIDNVRICSKDEFKMRTLSKGNFSQRINMSHTEFSCHFLEFPEWRPKKQIISQNVLPQLSNSANYTSFQLSWKTIYQQPFIINYKGSDICSKNTSSNSQRKKSNGWIVIKPKDTTITIENLIPYTHYDVTIIDPIFITNKSLPLNTNATEKPTKEELPVISIAPKTDAVKISILPGNCSILYGRIVNKIDIKEKSNATILVNSDSYVWANLTPYTNYTLVVETARSLEKLNDTSLKVVSYYNFTTKPDVAPALEFVEVYESGLTSISFRYRLPKQANGLPTQLHVSSCTPLQRDACSNSITNITSCTLWKDMYCVTVNNLMKRTSYKFWLSIKNINTNSFGAQISKLQSTMEAVPGKPSNLTYKLICNSDNPCSLNISWSHPYNQTGVITSFQIFLVDKKDIVIEEYVRIADRQYLPEYWHDIKFVPHAKTYNVSIRAVNYVYKSENVSITVKIDNFTAMVEQLPKLIANGTNKITYQVSKLDEKLSSSIIIVIVQRNDSTYTSISSKLISIAQNNLCLRNRATWIAGAWKISPDAVTNITIGNNTKTYSNILNNTVSNPPLVPETDYCINFIMENTYDNIQHVTVHHEKHIILIEAKQNLEDSTSKNDSSPVFSVGAIIVLILLILLVSTIVIFLLYRRRKQRRRNRLGSHDEHIYETMPSDDYDNFNVVYNAIYDKLDHD